MAYNWWHRAWWTAEGYQRRRYENLWWDDQNWRWRNDWKDWKYEEQWSVKRWDDSTSKLENERVQMEFRTFMRPPMVVPVPLCSDLKCLPYLLTIMESWKTARENR